MEDDDPDRAEREERRRELSRDREYQAKAAALTKELTAQYGPLNRSVA